MPDPDTSGGNVLTDAQIKAITKSLVQFGYDDLTVAEVREQADLVMRGEEPEDVIGMFVKSLIEEEGW